MDGATLIGYNEFTSKKGDAYTIAYIVYTPDEGKGQACKDAFLEGRPFTEEMIGQAVKVKVNLGNGRITGITAA